MEDKFDWRDKATIETLDSYRLEAHYLRGNLIQLVGWLKEGYRDDDGKTEAIKLIEARIEELEHTEKSTLERIFVKMKERDAEKPAP